VPVISLEAQSARNKLVLEQIGLNCRLDDVDVQRTKDIAWYTDLFG